MLGIHALIAAVHAVRETTEAVVVVVAATVVVGEATVVVVAATVVVVAAVVVGAAILGMVDVVVVVVATENSRRLTTIRVGTFSILQTPVTGQRNTPVFPSAHNSVRPGDMAWVLDLHPREPSTETMRVRAAGLSETLFQHRRGAVFAADHFSVVPLHESSESRRKTVPCEVMQTRIESTDFSNIDGAAWTIEATPEAASAKASAIHTRRPRLFTKNLFPIRKF